MKRLFSLVLVALLLLPPAAMAVEVEENRLYGDANGDLVVTSLDATVVMRHCVGLSGITDAECLLNADCTVDGAVTAEDAARILRYTVALDVMPNQTPRPTAVPTDTPTPTEAPTDTPTPTETPTPTPPPLVGKTIFLDAGHGLNPVTGSALGGRWTRADGTIYYEAFYVLQIARKTKTALEAQGATVLLTRSDEDMVGNYVRMALVHQFCLARLKSQTAEPTLLAFYDKMDAVMERVKTEYVPASNYDGATAVAYFDTPYDSGQTTAIHPDLATLFAAESGALFDDVLYISIHTNAPGGTDTSRRGMVVYCMNNTVNSTYYTQYRVEDNTRLGTALLNAVTEASGIPKNSSTVKYNDYFMVREHNLTAALLELGYHTNDADRAILESEAGQAAIALGITNGVLQYFTSQD